MFSPHLTTWLFSLDGSLVLPEPGFQLFFFFWYIIWLQAQTLHTSHLLHSSVCMGGDWIVSADHKAKILLPEEVISVHDIHTWYIMPNSFALELILLQLHHLLVKKKKKSFTWTLSAKGFTFTGVAAFVWVLQMCNGPTKRCLLFQSL